MEERYEVQTNSALIWFTGRADYSNFRKFAVDVSTIIKR
jgi:hypothetical protein